VACRIRPSQGAEQLAHGQVVVTAGSDCYVVRRLGQRRWAVCAVHARPRLR
jgi:hypothetical protein